jgi:hypothetical protein
LSIDLIVDSPTLRDDDRKSKKAPHENSPSWRLILTIVCVIFSPPHHQQKSVRIWRYGRLAQLVERTLSMREVGGSKPPLSTLFCLFDYFLSLVKLFSLLGLVVWLERGLRFGRQLLLQPMCRFICWSQEKG